jgi:hypothetical protein
MEVCSSRPQSDLQGEAEFQVDLSQCVKSFAIRNDEPDKSGRANSFSKKYTPGFWRSPNFVPIAVIVVPAVILTRSGRVGFSRFAFCKNALLSHWIRF